MVSLADFQKNRRTIDVIYFASTITVTYKPHEYTCAVASRAHEQPAAEFVELMLESWDLTDADEIMLPITAETLASLPMRLLQELSTAIIRDARLGEAQSS